MSTPKTEPKEKSHKYLRYGLIYDIIDDSIFDRGLDYDPDEERRENTPGLPTPGEDRTLSDEPRSAGTALFDFSEVVGKQPQKLLSITSTECFQESFFALSDKLGFEDHRELFRRAIFAAAENPSILQTESVDTCEAAYKETVNSRGGLRNRGPRQGGKFAKPR